MGPALITIFSILLFLVIVCFVIGFVIWYQAVPTKPVESYRDKPTDDPLQKEYRIFAHERVKELQVMAMEEVTIRSHDGLKLHAYYREASNKTSKTIISVHGYQGDAFWTSTQFSHWLVDFNYNILFIDLRSYGKSEGKYTTYGTLDSKDLLQWINYLIDRLDGEIEIALFGISMGGATVLNVSDKVPSEVKCIIDDCGFTSSYEMLKYLTYKRYHLPEFFLLFANVFSKAISKFSFKDNDARVSLKGSKVPILFIHSDQDKLVPLYMGEENYKACTSEKEIKIFKGAPHARSLFMYKEEYQRLVLDFLAKHL